MIDCQEICKLFFDYGEVCSDLGKATIQGPDDKFMELMKKRNELANKLEQLLIPIIKLSVNNGNSQSSRVSTKVST